MVVEGEDISSQEEGVMKEPTKDGWRKPRSIYRSFFGSGELTVGVIAVVCLVVVLVCHLFETPSPEASALRYTYANAGISDPQSAGAGECGCAMLPRHDVRGRSRCAAGWRGGGKVVPQGRGFWKSIGKYRLRGRIYGTM